MTVGDGNLGEAKMGTERSVTCMIQYQGVSACEYFTDVICGREISGDFGHWPLNVLGLVYLEEFFKSYTTSSYIFTLSSKLLKILNSCKGCDFQPNEI